MPSIRQDAWSHTEDVRLAETILRHIGEGSTQLAAFREAGGLLSRTPAACGFRWNSSVRKQFEKEMKEAKERRREYKKHKKTPTAQVETEISAESPFSETSVSEPFIDQMIRFLSQLKTGSSSKLSHDMKTQLDRLKTENRMLDEAYRRLEKEYSGMKKNYASLLNVLKIVDQARAQMPQREERKVAKDHAR
ncbi:hypothetical protein [Sporolactobacillus putidus]|uniref:RsfA family transcriptional regulator n=1 Tax=Sporolactobacillus putidus TaxID=492735 RepID=A0A917RYR6_9BACL|nr:hypothetical protein [Sporolactobacillus putidus]GGL44829.1 hypothetical protein GCM10007968_06120 [Sporolactobacillus putidus]